MSAFIRVKTYRFDVVVDAIVNVERIDMAWDAGCGDGGCRESFYLLAGRGLEHAAEPYESLAAKILAASSGEAQRTKEKENVPPAPPIREKETNNNYNSAHARTRFVKPTVEEVAAHVKARGYDFDAEQFWNYYESRGWLVGRAPMKSWQSACVTWQKAEKRRADCGARAERRTAAPKSSNWVGSTAEQRKEFCDGLEG